MAITFGEDPVHQAVTNALQRLHDGALGKNPESDVLDFKEETGRRGPKGEITSGDPRNPRVAKQLAKAAACMANTPGGGALIVGVSDTGELIGATSDSAWLRQQIYDLSGRRLTVSITEKTMHNARLLILLCPESLEIITVDGKAIWRVGDRCVDLDPSSWHRRHLETLQFDWSAQESTVSVKKVRPVALQIARDFLEASGEESAVELASATDEQLLRRLNVATAAGNLTNAGVLAFVGRDHECLDYIHRDVAGGDSTHRTRLQNRSLLEELHETLQAIQARNRLIHLSQNSLARGQVREVPARAAREAVVNGVAHRDWTTPEPTVVEHIGRTLRVTSPGGFYGGVTEENILTHPSRSRNQSLAALFAVLRIAEREGIGVDRMVSDMLTYGHQAPEIREISGPCVRTSLIGDNIDEAWLAWISSFTPPTTARDVNSLLIVRHLLSYGWVDAASARDLIQLDTEEAHGAIQQLARSTMNNHKPLQPVEGVPAHTPGAWRLTDDVLNILHDLDRQFGVQRELPSRTDIATNYAQSRGRISSTELGSLVSAASTNMGQVLRSLADDGVLVPSRPSRRGRGLYYLWAEPEIKVTT